MKAVLMVIVLWADGHATTHDSWFHSFAECETTRLIKELGGPEYAMPAAEWRDEEALWWQARCVEAPWTEDS